MRTNRPRREDPDRVAPHRQWEQLLKTGNRPRPNGATSASTRTNGSSKTGSATLDEPSGLGARTLDGTISDAVKLGYRIIEEQIDQGKKVASQLSGRSYSANTIGSDTSDFVRRLLRFYSDIGATCFDFIEAISRGIPGGMTAHESTSHPSAPAESTPSDDVSSSARFADAADGPTNVTVEIASSTPARVTVNLMPAASERSLGVHSLFPLDASVPPLRGVEFRQEPFTKTPTLVLRIPDGQPPGNYTGAVIDLETNQPLGTITVHICSN